MAQTNFTSMYANNITHARIMDLKGEGEHSRATFKVTVTGNKVRIAIWTNIDGDADNGKISVALGDPRIWFVAMQMLRDVAQPSFQDGERRVIRISRNGQQGFKGDPIRDGDLFIGKDKEGVVYLSYVRNNRPKIKFPLITSDRFYEILDSQGNPLDKRENSAATAVGYANITDSVVAATLSKEYADPKESKKGGNGGNGGNGGGWQNKNNGGGNNQQKSSEPSTGSDDFEF